MHGHCSQHIPKHNNNNNNYTTILKQLNNYIPKVTERWYPKRSRTNQKSLTHMPEVSERYIVKPFWNSRNICIDVLKQRVLPIRNISYIAATGNLNDFSRLDVGLLFRGFSDIVHEFWGTFWELWLEMKCLFGYSCVGLQLFRCSVWFPMIWNSQWFSKRDWWCWCFSIAPACCDCSFA